MIDKIKIKQAELESINAMRVHYTAECNTKFNDILVVNGLTNSDIDAYKKYAGCCHEVTESSQQVDETKQNNTKQDVDDQKSPLMELHSTLFKKLALLTHPDKGNEGFDFDSVKNAYDDDDTFTLIEYAIKYNQMDWTDINVHLVTIILEKKVIDLKNKIKSAKSMSDYHLLIHGNIDMFISSIKHIKEINKIDEDRKEYRDKYQKEMDNITEQRKEIQRKMEDLEKKHETKT